MSDWATHMLSTEKTLRALNKDLTDRPAAKPLTLQELDNIRSKVIEAMTHLAGVATWADRNSDRR